MQHIIRKERAVGLIPGAPTIYEVLEELAITVQQQLVDAPLPFCAFNGGGDVFVDVGNKSLGLEALMQYLKFNPSQVLTLNDTPGSSLDDQPCCACNVEGQDLGNPDLCCLDLSVCMDCVCCSCISCDMCLPVSGQDDEA